MLPISLTLALVLHWTLATPTHGSMWKGLDDLTNSEKASSHVRTKRYAGPLLYLLSGSRANAAPHLFKQRPSDVRKRPKVFNPNIPLLHQPNGLIGRAKRVSGDMDTSFSQLEPEVRMQHQLENLADLMEYLKSLREKRGTSKSFNYAPLLHNPVYLSPASAQKQFVGDDYQQNIPLLHQLQGKKRSKEYSCLECDTDDSWTEDGDNIAEKDDNSIDYQDTMSKRAPYRGSFLHYMSGKSFVGPSIVRSSPSRKAADRPVSSQYNSDLG